LEHFNKPDSGLWYFTYKTMQDMWHLTFKEWTTPLINLVTDRTIIMSLLSKVYDGMHI
jgi:hypothetical protein